MAFFALFAFTWIATNSFAAGVAVAIGVYVICETIESSRK